MSLLDWTQENAKEWDAFWKTPTGQKGLTMMKLATLVSPDSTPIAGVDANQIAAQAYSFHQGQASMFGIIDAFKSKAEVKPLPPTFTPPKPK